VAGGERRVTDRPPHRLTSLVLTTGTLAADAGLALGLLLSLTGRASAVDWALLGTLVLLATPALGLVVTAVEMRRAQPLSALLAIAVLVVLAGAVVIAVA
jgi:uncharacterized membrane protein